MKGFGKLELVPVHARVVQTQEIRHALEKVDDNIPRQTAIDESFQSFKINIETLSYHDPFIVSTALEISSQIRTDRHRWNF